MAKGFTQKEKEIISKDLLEKGRELFSLYGIKKTSISDITKEVGIAQGSFYIFYNSKEELYFDILEMEEQELKDKLLKDFDIHDATAGSFKKFLLSGVKAANENPFLRTLYNPNEYEALIRKLPEERIAKHTEQDGESLLPLIYYWQGQKKMKDTNPDAIMGVIRSLFLIGLHKKEIGVHIFDESLELLIELIAQGLFREGDKV